MYYTILPETRDDRRPRGNSHSGTADPPEWKLILSCCLGGFHWIYRRSGNERKAGGKLKENWRKLERGEFPGGSVPPQWPPVADSPARCCCWGRFVPEQWPFFLPLIVYKAKANTKKRLKRQTKISQRD